MRYLVTARVKPGREAALLRAIEDGTLGQGSVAGDEYLRNMQEARLVGDGKVKWVEVCFWTAVGFAVYTYAGYPIVLAILGAVFRRPVERRPIEPRGRSRYLRRQRARASERSPRRGTSTRAQSRGARGRA